MSNLADEQKTALKAAFPGTIPVMTGYIFLGMAFGILLNAKGYGIGWALLMSIFIYAGSMQYVAISLLAAAFNPIAAFIMTLMVNARHLFYGLSMLDKFKNTGKLKPYLIFGLTDETFSVLCGKGAVGGYIQTLVYVLGDFAGSDILGGRECCRVASRHCYFF